MVGVLRARKVPSLGCRGFRVGGAGWQESSKAGVQGGSLVGVLGSRKFQSQGAGGV